REKSRRPISFAGGVRIGRDKAIQPLEFMLVDVQRVAGGPFPSDFGNVHGLEPVGQGKRGDARSFVELGYLTFEHERLKPRQACMEQLGAEDQAVGAAAVERADENALIKVVDGLFAERHQAELNRLGYEIL